jgi:hypothetical protein
MNRKTFRAQQKAIRRKKAKEAFIVPIPAPITTPAVVSASEPLNQQPANLAPGFAAFLSELHKFAIAYQKLCLRASHRLMVAGLKEGTVDSTNRN